MLEHGAYTLILDRYYSTEQGIPADKAYRVTRAKSKEEKAAVDVVLEEFFTLVDGVWIKNRVQDVISKFHESEPERQAKQENDKERQRRSRERRKSLFDQLRAVGEVPAWDTKTSDLEAMVSRIKYKPVTPEKLPVTAPVTRDNTATQTPIPNTQYPIPNTQTQDTSGEVVHTQAQVNENHSVSRQAAVCMVIKSEGIGSVNPQHPDLLALIEQGADVGHFAAAAKLAVSRGKGFAYLLGVVKGQMAEAAKLASEPIVAPVARGASVESFKERDDRNARDRWEQMTGGVHPKNQPQTIRHVGELTPKFLEIAP